MRTVSFSNTDLQVTPLCLGTVNYGSALDRALSLRQMSRYVEQGGNFIDSARIYGVWAGEGEGLSERIIGQWLKETGNRDKVILATKGAHPDWENMPVMRVKPSDIESDLDNSLINLGTDVIDLYFLHRDDPAVPVIDILTTLENARKAGKIRYYGCSNWSLPRLKEAQALAKQEGFTGFSCNQLMWSLADVRFDGLADKTFILMDDKTYDYHKQTDLSAMAYMSVAKGYFMRKLAGEQMPASVTDVYDSPENDEIFEVIKHQARDMGISPLMASLGYLMAQPFPAVPIASFDDDQQLDDAMRCCNEKLPEVLCETFAKIKKFVTV